MSMDSRDVKNWGEMKKAGRNEKYRSSGHFSVVLRKILDKNVRHQAPIQDEKIQYLFQFGGCKYLILHINNSN